jgi:hypothetical protein
MKLEEIFKVLENSELSGFNITESFNGSKFNWIIQEADKSVTISITKNKVLSYYRKMIPNKNQGMISIDEISRIIIDESREIKSLFKRDINNARQNGIGQLPTGRACWLVNPGR